MGLYDFQDTLDPEFDQSRDFEEMIRERLKERGEF